MSRPLLPLQLPQPLLLPQYRIQPPEPDWLDSDPGRVPARPAGWFHGPRGADPSTPLLLEQDQEGGQTVSRRRLLCRRRSPQSDRDQHAGTTSESAF